MSVIDEIRERADHFAAFAELAVAMSELPESALGLSDESLRELVGESSALMRTVQTLHAVLAGVVAKRSTRELGVKGFAGGSGHRGAVQFIQTTTGVSKADAVRTVRVGEALLDAGGADVEGVMGDADGAGGAAGAGGTDGDGDRGGTDGGGSAAVPPVPWHQPLRDGLLAGALTPAQHDAIHRGLQGPPIRDGVDPVVVVAAWRAAAAQLVVEASGWSLEQLGAHARTLRDMLDPLGAEERFAARFQNRGFRFWVDRDGAHHGSVTFDDEMGAWVKSLMDAALRPRRGGPRFVSAEERAAARELSDDPRSNEQLAYDLLVDVLRAGALADAKTVYGTREAGVRVVTIADPVAESAGAVGVGGAVSVGGGGGTGARDAFGRLARTGFVEDGGAAVPGSVIDRAICTTGIVPVTVDGCGNPLDVGREQRLFTTTQRVALSIRDGGCMWPGCDRAPSYCEAHHCDPWAEGGATDCDVGILLCRFHHLLLHNAGWKITREQNGGFVLHPPPGEGREPVRLASKSPLRWLWDPPPDRTGWRTPPSA